MYSAALLLAGSGGLCSCNAHTHAPPATIAPDTIARPATAAAAAAQPGEASHALHNVHRLGDALISGAVPDGEAALDELRSMGVKTIISVDGAMPDVAAAEARGMRYVHIPITYAEVTGEQRHEIARAIRDLPGPVYMHCHHGKHRGPAAAASAAVALRMISPDEGVAFMKEAGTAPNYTGLYACVAAAVIASDEALDKAPSDFPSVRRAHGIVAAMIEVDAAFEHLGDIRAAQWKVPADHPDLVPAAEAGRLTDNLRFTLEDQKSKDLGAAFAAKLQKAIAETSALEEMLIASAPADQLEATYKAVNASCKDCHAAYRDKPKD